MDSVGLRRLLVDAIIEDERSGDITSKIVPNIDVDAEIIAKAEGIAAGITEAEQLFKEFNVDVKLNVTDGDVIHERDVLMRLHGPARKILLVERTALNFISYMSGIATLTKKYVDAAKPVKIASTRKTHPYFRYFKKSAVEIGGGLTHRFALDDLFLIKDNHLTLFDDITEPIKIAKETLYHKVEIEVSSMDDALKCAKAGADIIMLDNMSSEQVKEVVEKLKEENLRDKVIIEASGGITLENISGYSNTGVDVISTSDPTTARALDVALKFL